MTFNLFRYAILFFGISFGVNYGFYDREAGFENLGLSLFIISVIYSGYLFWLTILKPSIDFEKEIKDICLLKGYDFSKKSPAIEKQLLESILYNDIYLGIHNTWIKNSETYDLVYGQYISSGNKLVTGWFVVIFFQFDLQDEGSSFPINRKKYNFNMNEFDKYFLIKSKNKKAFISNLKSYSIHFELLNHFKFEIQNNYLLLDLISYNKWIKKSSYSFDYLFLNIEDLARHIINKKSEHQRYSSTTGDIATDQ